jgi:hypothetical protein
MSRATAVAYAVLNPLALVALVFIPVGRIDWRSGWIFVAVLIASFVASALVLARVNPVIYRARSRFQKGTRKWDLALLAVMLPIMVAEIPVATLDAGRLRWSTVPLWVVVAGYALLVGGIAVTAWAQAVNPFFEPGVRIQTERGQRPITSGPYRIVRRGRNSHIRRYRPRPRLVVGADPCRCGQSSAGREDLARGQAAWRQASRVPGLCTQDALPAGARYLVSVLRSVRFRL